MKKLFRRGCALLLLLALLAGLCLQAGATTGSKIYNNGARGTVCTALSSQAKAYYTGSNTYDKLSLLDGASSVTDSYAATQGNELYSALASLMSETQTASVTYKSLSSNFYYTDTQNGNRNSMTLFWAGAQRDWNGSYVNREHVWPKSHASFYQLNGGADIHHLRPASAKINQGSHGNLPYGTATGGTSIYDEQNNFGGYYNNSYFEPRDDIKGDTARILLYVYVRWGQPNLYSNVASSNLPKMDSDDSLNDGRKVIESLDTLLRWCEEDPVDTWEMGRNDAAERIQGNRNVFIDYPELAYLMFSKEIPNMATPSGIAAQQTPSHTHTWGAWTVTKPATCTENGTETRSCTACGETEEREIKAEGHKLQKTEAKDPTCTEPGNIAYWYCTACKTYFSDQNAGTEIAYEKTPIPAAGHKWNGGTVTKEPTATEPGVRTYTCSVCGTTKTEAIPATGSTTCDGGSSCPSHSLTDVPAPSNWAHQGIDYALEHQLMNGMGDNEFQPNTTMTRGMLVTVLWRYAGSPKQGTNTFTDVPSGKYYTDAVAWAAANGVVNGVGDGKFNPDGNITREQMVTILYRYCKQLAINTSVADDLSAFPDADTVGNSAKDAMRWAVAEGILGGKALDNSGTVYLQPKGSATRAEVATILMRFLENVVK